MTDTNGGGRRVPLSTDSVVSVGLVIVILSAVVWVTSQFSKINEMVLPEISALKATVVGIGRDVNELKVDIRDVSRSNERRIDELERLMDDVRKRVTDLEKR